MDRTMTPTLHYGPSHPDYVILPLSQDLRILINAVAKICPPDNPMDSTP